MEFIVFTDESSITDSRFQSLSAFSFPYCYYKELTDNFNTILKDSNVTEFKWQKLKNAKNYFCAEKTLNLIFNFIYKYQIRIDTIVWDTHDARHNINSRDDMANYVHNPAETCRVIHFKPATHSA